MTKEIFWAMQQAAIDAGMAPPSWDYACVLYAAIAGALGK